MSNSRQHLNSDAEGNSWSRLTSTTRATIAALGIFLLVAIILVVVACVGLQDKSETASTPVSVCRTEVCNRTSVLMRANMNTSHDPCDNFYEYACGGFQVNHKIPDEKSRLSSFGMISDEVEQILSTELLKSGPSGEVTPLAHIRQFYQKCSNQESLKKQDLTPLQTLVNEVVFTKNTKEQIITSAVSKAVSSFISVSIVGDPNNPKKRILQLDQPSFSVSKKDLVANESDTKATAIRLAYTNFIKAGLTLYEPKTGEKQLAEAANKIISLDVSLAKIAAKDEDRRNASEIINRFKVSELSRAIEKINLTTIVEGYLGKMKTDEVIVADINYMRQLGQLLDEKRGGDAFRYYHTWKVIEDYGRLLSEKFIDAHFEFLKVKNGLKKKPDQRQMCIDTLVRLALPVIGRVYVDAVNFTSENKRGAEEMIARIQKSMENIIKQKDWMDEGTKKKAVDKLSKMKVNVAYPEWIRNNTSLNESFAYGRPGTNYAFDLLLEIRLFTIRDAVSKLNEEIEFEKEWPMSPALVNAAYSPEQNSITFPAAILRGVFYEAGRPDYCNYGAIGSVIGHEITHGFDDQGAQYDADGRLANWWTESTLNSFHNLTQAIVKQYSAVIDDTTGINLNGANTQGENIADNGGIREAYGALFESEKTSHLPALSHMELFSPQQMFFLSHANVWCSIIRPDELRQRINTDPHSPEKYRANLPLMNFEKFADAFSCPQGSRMNPANKVRVW